MESLWTLEDVIDAMKNERRKRPWQYLTCTSQLSILQAERNLVSEALEACDKRLRRYQADGVHHLHRYAKLSCRHLCDAVMDRLPRELRDQIYEHLLPKASIEVVSHWERYLVWWSEASRVPMNTCDYRWQLQYGTNVLPPHCLDKGHLGTAMLRELVHTWDRITSFEVHVSNLTFFIRSKHWQHGRCVPDVVRNLTVTANYPKHFLYDIGTQVQNDMCNDIRVWDKTIVMNLESLMLLKPGTKVSLLLARSHSNLPIRQPSDRALREQTLLGSISPIIPTLREVQEHGLLLEVFLYDHGCQLSGPDTPVSREVWQASMEAHNSAHDDAVRNAVESLRV
jgi:hypothetical protein